MSKLSFEEKKSYTYKLFLGSPAFNYVVSALNMLVSMMVADNNHSELTEWAYSNDRYFYRANDVIRTMHKSEMQAKEFIT